MPKGTVASASHVVMDMWCSINLLWFSSRHGGIWYRCSSFFIQSVTPVLRYLSFQYFCSTGGCHLTMITLSMFSLVLDIGLQLRVESWAFIFCVLEVLKATSSFGWFPSDDRFPSEDHLTKFSQRSITLCHARSQAYNTQGEWRQRGFGFQGSRFDYFWTAPKSAATSRDLWIYP